MHEGTGTVIDLSFYFVRKSLENTERRCEAARKRIEARLAAMESDRDPLPPCDCEAS